MRTFEAGEAETPLCALVEAAERGEATTITKNGKPSAVLVPIALADRPRMLERPNFGSFLLSVPDEIDPASESFHLRDAGL